MNDADADVPQAFVGVEQPDLLAVDAVQARLCPDPDPTALVLIDGAHGRVGETLPAGSGAHAALLVYRKSGLGTDPQTAFGIDVQRADTVTGQFRCVAAIEDSEAGTVEARQAFQGA